MVPRAMYVLFTFNACAMLVSVSSPVPGPGFQAVLRHVMASKLTSLTNRLGCQPQHGERLAVLLVTLHVRLGRHMHVASDNEELNAGPFNLTSTTEGAESAEHSALVIRDDEAQFTIPVKCNETSSALVIPTELTRVSTLVVQKPGGLKGLSSEAITAIIVGSAILVFLVMFICALVNFLTKVKQRKYYNLYQKQEREVKEAQLIKEQQEELRRQKTAITVGTNFRFTDDTTLHQIEEDGRDMSPEQIAAVVANMKAQQGADIEQWLIAQEAICIIPGKEIGKGAFGKVFAGTVRQSSNGKVKNVEVAIKTLKSVTLMTDISDFVEEALVMKDFSHPNIVALIGVCMETNGQPPLVCLEFMDCGDLKSYLKRMQNDNVSETNGPADRLPPLEAGQLLRFCVDIAQGMAYLASRGFVHRDLACRNCMLNKDKVVKIGDFGLARDVHEENYYRMGTAGRLPVKWMAIESLDEQVFTSMSDVWSFGIVMWEIFSLGQTPYPGLENQDILPYLKSGHRLMLPRKCIARDVYPIMASCWSLDKNERPTFNDLIVRLKEHRETLYVNLSQRYQERTEYQNMNPRFTGSAEKSPEEHFPANHEEASGSNEILLSRAAFVMHNPASSPEQVTADSFPPGSDEAFNPGYRFVEPVTYEES